MIIIYILAVIGISAGVLFYLQKTGKIKDTDGDFIPDVVEDKIEQAEAVVKETKRRVKRVVEEAKDVVDAAKGKPKKTTAKKATVKKATPKKTTAKKVTTKKATPKKK